MKKTTMTKILILLLVLTTAFAMSACKRKTSPNHAAQQPAATPTPYPEGEVEAIELDPESPEGYIGTIEIDGVDCPLILHDNLSYAIVKEEAMVVYTLFTDDVLESYTIPEYVDYELKHYPVTSIDDDAFTDFTDAVTISIPSSVKKIGIDAFDGCEGLEEIIIAEGVESIASGAFSNCTALKSITLPSTIKELGDGLFFGCEALETVVLSEGITAIPDDTFSNCEALASIVIPSTLKTIGSEAFWTCTSLGAIRLPDGLTTIGDRCFYDCESLTELTLPSTLTSIGDSLFDYCEKLAVIYVPSDKVDSYTELFEEYEPVIRGY
ncbi:MAG: leucine-rich repeat domain-containing protein [Lachnospiraceae bacterium]|nr:leucine-rich repeat domain-containing protein [Lachnospiraceae bacterium]